MRPARAFLLLLLAAPAAAQEPTPSTRLALGAGFAWLSHTVDGALREDGGVALELRMARRLTPRAGLDVTLTWGLTDWDRAREWIDAGNRAGSWTTDQFPKVEAWVREGEADDTAGLRLLGAFFADALLVMTYAAVPFCYVGSVGGATSHLQLDLTGSVHLGDDPAADAWIEGGGGVAALPHRIDSASAAVGPIVGAGARLGPLRVGGRVLWSPHRLNGAPGGGTVTIGAATVSLVR